MDSLERLDIALTQKGLASSRTRAQELIHRGSVQVNGTTVTKAHTQVSSHDTITLTEDLKFVSRAGYKLEGALQDFKINIKNTNALDIGSSTGGFTQCLLMYGAHHVTAVDVGTNQLSPTLRNDPRITLYEQKDIRDFIQEKPENKFDIITIDLSFISLTHILGTLHSFMKPQTKVLALIKPQFELSKDKLNKQGIVKNVSDIEHVCTKIENEIRALNYTVHGIKPAHISGSDGNQEYVVYFSL